MRYEGNIYRPPSEADAFILQATVGCSWNACTYCDMYRAKKFRVRDLDEILEDIDRGAEQWGGLVRKVFVADGDPLMMGLDQWAAILQRCNERFPILKRVSTYATAINLLRKTPDELSRLAEMGLKLLYVGPESGDDITLKRIAKGADFDDHVRAAARARDAGLQMSVIFLLGAGGLERSLVHAEASARLLTEMDPQFVSLLTLTVIPGTPIARQLERGRFQLPEPMQLMREMRIFVEAANPTCALFRTNHASNYLPLSGTLPDDRERIVAVLDRALEGRIGLRPEWARGL